jgi:hypothetical protein
MVGERVRRDRGAAADAAAARLEVARASGATRTTAVATTAAIAAESAATTAESATATVAASKGTTSTSEAAAAVAPGAHGRASKAVLANLEHAALPVIAVELLDGGACVVGRLEHDDTGALGSAVRAEMDIGANDTSGTSCRSGKKSG